MVRTFQSGRAGVNSSALPELFRQLLLLPPPAVFQRRGSRQGRLSSPYPPPLATSHISASFLVPVPGLWLLSGMSLSLQFCRNFSSRFVACLYLAALFILFPGCTGFQRDWKRTTAQPSHPSGNIEGAWDGSWQSEPSRHHGRLRCLVTPEGPTGYVARFRGTWARVFSFEYKVPVEVHPTNGVSEFKGTKNLGRLVGGVYSYEGRVAEDQFHATYSCSIDHGTFEMKRSKSPETK